MTDIEGFLTIYGHSDNLLNNRDYLYTAIENVKMSKFATYTFATARHDTILNFSSTANF